jgi:hypothetical protein
MKYYPIASNTQAVYPCCEQWFIQDLWLGIYINNRGDIEKSRFRGITLERLFYVYRSHKMKTLTDARYKDLGFIKSGNSVKSPHGDIFYPKKSKSPAKAIRLFCKECMGLDRRLKTKIGLSQMIDECTGPLCPLFDFRYGKNPFYARIGQDSNMGAVVQRKTLLKPFTRRVLTDENRRTGSKP